MRARIQPGPETLLAAIVALAVMVVPAAAAAATTRHASPAGSGETCSAELPCSVVEALAKSEPGDTVVMAGDAGPYGSPTSISTTLQVHTGISLEGAAGQPMPQVYSTAPGPAIRMETGAGRLSNVAIHYDGPEAALRGAGTIERVLALGSAFGCELGPGTTLVDSVCAGKVGIYDNVGEAWTLTFRNDTIYGTETGLAAISGVAGLQVTAVNTIIRGGLRDIEALQSSTGTVTVSLNHSNYASVKSEGGATVTAPGSGTNQVAAPLFANAAGNDFAELSGSPTIDAGVNETANGPFDVLGNPRTSNVRGTCTAMTDIGAYELNTGLVVDCFGPPPEKKSTKKVKIIKAGRGKDKSKSKPAISVLRARIRKRRATFRFEGSGGTVGFECKLDKKRFHPCRSPKTYKRLKPGEHEFSVRAVDSKGKHSKSAKRKFRIKASLRR